jgi:Xaa-Pro aminopeptidase
VLVLIKSDDTHNHSVLFNRVRDLTAEIWFGRRLGQDAAPAKLGVDRALAFSEINQQLHLLLNGLDAVYHAQGEYAWADEIVCTALDKLRKGSRQNLHAPAAIIDWRPMVHEMRLFKSPEEIAVMRRAGEITALAHTRAMEKCRPGMFEYQLEGRFTTNLPAMARVIRPITRLSAAVKTAVSCITPKMKVKCAMAIWC